MFEYPLKVKIYIVRFWLWGSVVSLVGVFYGLQHLCYWDWISIPSRDCKFVFSGTSRPTLALTQTPTRWVPGALCPHVKGPELVAALHSVPTHKHVKFTSITPIRFYWVVATLLRRWFTLRVLWHWLSTSDKYCEYESHWLLCLPP